MIKINMLIEWINEGSRIDRIVWIDKKIDLAYLINVQSNKFPVGFRLSYVIDSIKNGVAIIKKEDNLISLALEEEIPTLYKEYRDRTWEIISFLVRQEPYIYEAINRRKLILKVCETKNISESTVKRLLKRYLVRGKNKNALIPDYVNSGGRGKEKGVGDIKRGRPRKNKELLGEGLNINEDIKKIFRISINKYYNTSTKNPLTTAYELMIKKFFKDIENKSIIDSNERLPTYAQFKYWFYKERDFKKEIVTRFSAKKYEQNNRRILGTSTAESMFPGRLYQIDATVADLYVVSAFNRSWVIGRPVLYMVLDVYSRLITGFYVGLEGPSYIGAAMALSSVVADKVKLCKEYGIDITPEQWPVNNLPEHIIADRGELEGKNIEGLINTLGIGVKLCSSFRADWKGCIEQNFRLINLKTKPFIPGKIDGTFRERGDKDYRLDAKLTLKEFTAIIVRTILYHNNHHILKNYDRSEYQIEDDIKCIPIELWNWGIENTSGVLRTLPEDIVKLNLLPMDYATVTSRGIKFKGVFYASKEALKDGWFEKARNNGSWKIKVAYDLRKMDYIYIKKDNGRDFDKCFLLDHQHKYKGKSFEDVQYLLEREKLDIDLMRENELQEKVNLMENIEKIVKESKENYVYITESNNQKLKGISDNRKFEKELNRQDESFDLGIKENEVIKVEDKNNKDDFNECVINELALLKKKQREALDK